MKEIREMKKEDLQKRLNELRLELMKERAQSEVGGTPSNPGRVRELRRTIARILTKLNEG